MFVIFKPFKLTLRFTAFISTMFCYKFQINYQVDINLKPSIRSGLYVIVLSLSSFFLIGTEKVIYFSLHFLLSIQVDPQILLLAFCL